jgi:glutathione synthase/RimK-type ligase-like ATP-grasp enzyme
MASAELHGGLVLVITNPCDVVADRVVHELRSRGCDVARFDPAELPLRSTITTGSGTDGIAPYIYRNWGPSIWLGEVRSIWYRRPGSFVLPPYQKEYAARFARTELSMALGGVLRSLDCYWMNHPSAIREASYKAEQIARALRYGLRVPDTCITSQPGHAKAFFERHDGRLIIKALGDSDIYAPGEGPTAIGNILTSLMAKEDYAKLDRVQHAPVLLQEHIVKRSDIRVTIVEDTLYSVEIDSQSREDSRVDWRVAGMTLPHKVIELPQATQEKLISLTRSYGLNFAAIDMVRSEDNENIFLEINPGGEWGWLDTVAGLDIAGRVAIALAAGLESGTAASLRLSTT